LRFKTIEERDQWYRTLLLYVEKKGEWSGENSLVWDATVIPSSDG
jgi:hypothetical protein